MSTLTGKGHFTRVLSALCAVALLVMTAVSAFAATADVTAGNHPDARNGGAGFYLWHEGDGHESQAHLQWRLETADPRGVQHTYSGTLATDGQFRDVHRLRLERGDSFGSGQGSLTFTFTTKGHDADGLTFEVAGGSHFSLSLLVDGNAAPVNDIFLGRSAAHPASSPFSVFLKKGSAPTLSGAIHGLVTNQATGAPVSGAHLTVLDGSSNTVGSATSGSDGGYTVGNLAPGTYTLAIAGSGFQAAQVSGVAVGSNASVSENVALVAAVQNGSISGVVTWDGTSFGLGVVPVPGAQVTLQGAATFTASTDTSGAYAISNVPAGSYTLSVSATNFATSTSTVVITGGANLTANVALLIGAGA